jgi:histidyl-tRNA synthetase
MKTPQPVRGTQSLIGEEADRFAQVVATFDRVRRLYGFKRIEMPVIEPTAVFARTMGETTDVVSKEMYSFDDRSGESITLRPEFTAGICRAFLSEGWQRFAPLKVATHGAAFRYERPQKGRFRQFHQLDAEVIGSGEPAADVELLAFGAQLLAELGISGVRLKLNTLGDAASRDAWRAQLVEHFESVRAELSEDSQARLEKNPLRILDSKDARDRPFAESAPPMVLTSEAEDFFGSVKAGLDAAGVDYEIAPHLVRGLDYYRHTAFEFVTDQLGAQGTVLAGGRYDGLIEQLGGPHTPAVGWAAGIERLAMLIDAPQTDTPLVTVIPDDANTEADAIRVTASLRRSGIVADLAFRGNAKRRFELAAKSGSIGRVVLRRSGPSGLPDRVGIHLRVNQPASHDRENDLRPIILAALERDYQVRRFEAVEGASWSPDAVLQEKPGA